MTAPEIAVPGWFRCPNCGRRLYVPGDPSALRCATCGCELEPVLQAERRERERTPGAVLVSEVER